MAETVNTLFLKARALLDEYTDDGVLISEDDVIDMQEKSIQLADMAQKELMKISDLFGTFEFARKSYDNLLGEEFDIEDFEGTTQYYPSEDGVQGAKAYYIEADGDGSGNQSIVIQEKVSGTWTTIETLTLSQSVTALTAHKGALTYTSATNYFRIVISGTTHFRHANRCLYDVPFADSLVPDYRAWVKIAMPSDFKSVDQIVSEYVPSQYKVNTDYKFEQNKHLYVNYYFEGNFRISYRPIPTTLTAITDSIQVDDITAQAIVYYVAARLAPYENKELVNYFESKYLELKAENSRDVSSASQLITDYYG